MRNFQQEHLLHYETKLKEIIDSNNESRIFFQNFSRWLVDWKNRLLNSKVRVGIIGITSSGKSTLFNAIIGHDFLPTGVAPTSGIQITCEYGKRLKVEVFYDSLVNKTEIINDIKEISQKIKLYGNEKTNPKNKFNIEEIKIYTPEFMLDKKIILCDTPGLDAYGHDDHEKITLRLVLPAIDIVMYLTQIKCDSDGKNLAIIDEITSKFKPLIVVQNKSDAIQELISRRGIDKTKEEIKNEHYQRLKKMLNNANKDSVKTAPIIQISAKNKSNINDDIYKLNNVLLSQIKLNSENRNINFLNQLKTELQRHTKIISEMLEGHYNAQSKMEKFEKIQLSVNKCQNKLEAYLNELDNKTIQTKNHGEELIWKIVKKYQKSVYSLTSNHSPQNIYEAINNLKFKNPESLSVDIKEYKLKLETSMKNVIKLLDDSIRIVNYDILNICKNLNLMESQVIRTFHIGIHSVNITETTESKIKKRRKRVEQTGIGGSLKRGIGGFLNFFGADTDDWGYDYEEYNEEEVYVNIKKFTKDIYKRIQEWKSFIKQNSEKFILNSDYSLNIIKNKLRERGKEINNYKLQAISPELSIQFLETAKDILKNDASIKINNHLLEYNSLSEKKTANIELEISQATLSLFEYAKARSYYLHHSLRDEMISNVPTKNNYIDILAWSDHAIDEFINLFFDDIEKKENKSWSINRLIAKDNKKVFFNGSILFIIVNSSQSGSAEKKIMKLYRLLTNFQKTGKIIWVFDNIQHHLTGSDETIIESFTEFIRIAEGIVGTKNIYKILVSCRDLYYSILFNELYFNSINWSNDRKRQKVISDFNCVFNFKGEDAHKTAKYISEYFSYIAN